MSLSLLVGTIVMILPTNDINDLCPVTTQNISGNQKNGF